MCGIVGLYLKNDKYQHRLGKLFEPMLEAMHNRGPDSAGFAIYRDKVAGGEEKVILQHPDENYDWHNLVGNLTKDTGKEAWLSSINSTHAKVVTTANGDEIRTWLQANADDVSVMSVGSKIEIYKECGPPAEVAKRFDLASMQGTHILGHTRMATESAVTTQGSHPFTTGEDLCLVHNGSLSNHSWWREQLTRKGQAIQTGNDTEVAAAYLADRCVEGDDLQTSMERAVKDLDGFFTFAVGTEHGFSVVRDEFACKPAVLAETDNYVAIASEYQALSSLPGIDQAKLWEPAAAKVYSW